MKVRVKARFIDKVTREFYQVGQTIEIPESERVADLADRGYIDPVKTEQVETADKTPRPKKPGKK